MKYKDKTVVLNGLEAASDKRRFIVNLDDNHWNVWLNELCLNGEVTKEKLNEYVEWYAGTDITDLKKVYKITKITKLSSKIGSPFFMLIHEKSVCNGFRSREY